MVHPRTGGVTGFWTDSNVLDSRDADAIGALGGGAGVARPSADPDAPITPDRRLRVFVSSTMEELAVERRAVRDAVTRLRLTPVLFELGARPHPPRDLYRAYLTQSEVFVGIYGERYGWVAQTMDISGLEDEFDLSAGM